MIKIYNAIGENGKVILKKGIKFNHGSFNTGYNGYGSIMSGRNDCKTANYLLEDLEYFRRYVLGIERIDGFIRNNNFMFYNPYSIEELENLQKSVGLPKRVLNEEGILLFTDYANVDYHRDDNEAAKVKRIFGRFPETGAYILLPGAELEMSFPAYHNESKAEYEVIESGSVPKQLYLTKKDRKNYTEE